VTNRPVRAVLERARHEMEALTGRPVDAVTGVRRAEDGWELTVEVVELERIPASTSVLGAYEVVVDSDGSIVEYQRTQRYYRNQASEGDGG
jgi:hypothetical protein